MRSLPRSAQTWLPVVSLVVLFALAGAAIVSVLPGGPAPGAPPSVVATRIAGGTGTVMPISATAAITVSPALTVAPQLTLPVVVATSTVSNPTATPMRWSAEKIKATGERPLDPTGNALFLAWSPDSAWFLFQKSNFSYTFTRNGAGESGLIGDLWLMGVNGTNRRRIAQAVGTWSWSADAKYVAYSTPAQAEGTQGELYVLDMTSSQTKKVASVTFTTSPQLQWLPSNEVTFLRNGYLFAIRPDGTGERQISSIYFTPPGLTDANNNPRFRGLYLLSPTGKRIAYWNRTLADSPLWLANLDGSNPIKIVNSGGAYSWSPKGDTLAFATALEKSTEIWLVNADGSSSRRLITPTTQDEINWDPVWSPDGQSLIYVREYLPAYDNRTPRPPPPRKYELWIVNHDGTQPRQLLDYAGDAPRWAPMGLALAFNRRVNEKYDITPTNLSSFIVTLNVTP